MRLSYPLVVVVVAACGKPPAALDHPPDAAGDAVDPDGPPAPFGDPLAALAELPPACSGSGWCWWAPRPSGTSYSRIVASAPDNIWLVGGGPPAYAAILQWNGYAWIEHKPPLPACPPNSACPNNEYAFPMAISTGGPNNTWLVYTNLTEHWDGTKWTIMDIEHGNASVNGVWVAPDGAAWVTSDRGVKRWHNGVATPITDVGFNTVWGTASDDIFFTTIGGVTHYDGTTFRSIYQGTKTAAWYQGVKHDVWIGGSEGALFHWDGDTITELDTGLPRQAKVMSADYAASDDVTWIATATSASPEYFLHWNGTELTKTPIEPAFTELGDRVCLGLGAAKVIDGRFWIVCGDGAVAERSGPGTIAAIIERVAGTGDWWGTSRDDLYHAAGSTNTLRHWDGVAWTSTPKRLSSLRGNPNAGIGGAHELFGTVAEIVDGQYVWWLERFDGATWWPRLELTRSPTIANAHRITDVWPLKAGEALIVGAKGAAFHYLDGTLTPITSGTTVDLNMIWGRDPDHLWVAGDDGTLLIWRRSNPGVLEADASFPTTTDHLRRITGAGGSTWLLAWSGVHGGNQTYAWMKPAEGAWRQVDTKVPPTSIVALSDTNVVISATDSGLLARWDGVAFQLETYPSWRALQRLHALPDGTTYLTGSSGIVWHP